MVSSTQAQTRLRERAAYGLYFFGQGLVFTMVSQHLMYYYTDYALLPSLAASVILVAGKIWDAVNDTLFGLIMDKVRFKSGKRFLPWLRISTALIPPATVLLFVVDAVPGTGWRILLAVVTYIHAVGPGLHHVRRAHPGAVHGYDRERQGAGDAYDLLRRGRGAGYGAVLHPAGAGV